MTQFNSLNDLRTWVAERTTAETTQEDTDAIIQAIRVRRERPAFGMDWTEFLDSLPEHLIELTYPLYNPYDPLY